MKKIIFLSFIMSMSLAHAKMGSEGVGGGDLCEDRIKVVRDDIKTWIKGGGPAGLKLNNGMSVQQYSDSMLNSIGNAKIRCVNSGDEGYPVSVDGVAKVCRFDTNEKKSIITCDFNKFQAMKETTQYVLVHHEYAGLSQVEIPNGSDSDYSISNQLSAFVVNEVVKKLSIKPAELKSFQVLNGYPENSLALAWGIPGQKINFDIFSDMTADEMFDYVYNNDVRNFLVDSYSKEIIMVLDYDSVLFNFKDGVIGGNHFYLEAKEFLIKGLPNCVFNTAIIESGKWDSEIITIVLADRCNGSKNIILDAEDLNVEIQKQMLSFIDAENLSVFNSGASNVSIMDSTLYKGERVNRFHFSYQIPKSEEDKSIGVEANIRFKYVDGKIKPEVLSLEQIAE
jgi:hypothetical protein